MVHPQPSKHAIMQVSPNERRHNRANAEQQGRLLIKRKDSIMKISARNQIKGTVKTVKEGGKAVAIIKATDVMVAVD